MVMSCSAFNCTNRSGKSDACYHRFPKDPDLRKKWILATKRDKFDPGPQASICSEHFKPEDYYPTYASGLRKLRQNVVPSLFNFPPHLQKTIKERKKRKRSLSPPVSSPQETQSTVRSRTYKANNTEANNVFTITEDYIESIIKVDPDEITLHPEERLLKPETDTHKESARLHHKNYKDYRQTTEKELERILEFLTDNKGDGIYNCPKCRCICGTFHEIKIHLLAHTERRLCDICFKIFNSEVETVSHSRLHAILNVKILDDITDHQYSIKKS